MDMPFHMQEFRGENSFEEDRELFPDKSDEELHGARRLWKNAMLQLVHYDVPCCVEQVEMHYVPRIAAMSICRRIRQLVPEKRSWPILYWEEIAPRLQDSWNDGIYSDFFALENLDSSEGSSTPTNESKRGEGLYLWDFGQCVRAFVELIYTGSITWSSYSNLCSPECYWYFGERIQCPTYQNCAMQVSFSWDAEIQKQSQVDEEILNVFRNYDDDFALFVGVEMITDFKDGKCDPRRVTMIAYMVDKFAWAASNEQNTDWLEMRNNEDDCRATVIFSEIVSQAVLDSKYTHKGRLPPWDKSNHNKYLLDPKIIDDEFNFPITDYSLENEIKAVKAYLKAIGFTEDENAEMQVQTSEKEADHSDASSARTQINVKEYDSELGDLHTSTARTSTSVNRTTPSLGRKIKLMLSGKKPSLRAKKSSPTRIISSPVENWGPKVQQEPDEQHSLEGPILFTNPWKDSSHPKFTRSHAPEPDDRNEGLIDGGNTFKAMLGDPPHPDRKDVVPPGLEMKLRQDPENPVTPTQLEKRRRSSVSPRSFPRVPESNLCGGSPDTSVATLSVDASSKHRDESGSLPETLIRLPLRPLRKRHIVPPSQTKAWSPKTAFKNGSVASPSSPVTRGRKTEAEGKEATEERIMLGDKKGLVQEDELVMVSGTRTDGSESPKKKRKLTI